MTENAPPDEVTAELSSLLSRLPRVSGNLTLVLGGPFVETAMEFWPKVRRSELKLLCARRMGTAGLKRATAWIGLGEVSEGELRKQCVLVYAADEALIDGIESVLRRRGINLRAVVPEDPVVMKSILGQQVTRRENSIRLHVEVTSDRLAQVFTRGERVVYFRQSDMRFADSKAIRVAQEVQRTSVFFHRRFAPCVVDGLNVIVGDLEDAGAIDSELSQVAGLEVIPAERGWSTNGPPDSELSSDELAILGTAGAASRDAAYETSRLRTEGSIRTSTQRRIAAALLTLAIGLGAGAVAFQHATNEKLAATRQHVRVVERGLNEARKRVHEAEATRDRSERILASVEELGEIVGETPELSLLLLSLAREISPLATVEEISCEAMDREFDTSPVFVSRDPWRIGLRVRIASPYFKSGDLIQQIQFRIADIAGVSRSAVDASVDPGSLPFRTSDSVASKGTQSTVVSFSCRLRASS